MKYEALTEDQEHALGRELVRIHEQSSKYSTPPVMSKTYTPRRASKRWLANAPAHVLDLFKTKYGTYKALYTGPLLTLRNPDHGRTMANMIVQGREMDDDPSHPQGIGIWFELDAWGAAQYRYAKGKRRITWDSLPEKVKACIMRDGQTA